MITEACKFNKLQKVGDLVRKIDLVFDYLNMIRRSCHHHANRLVLGNILSW